MPPRIIAKNLALPRGLVGRFIAGQMNRRNAAMNAFARDVLAVEQSDRVLEIGFGGGLNLGHLLAQAGSIAGVDPSATMVAAANDRHRAAVAAGHAVFEPGRVEALPFAADVYDKVITVNTVYFWTGLDAGFSEIARVLRPGGRVAVGFLPAEPMSRLDMPADIFTLRCGDDVIAAMTLAGFADAELRQPTPDTAWIVATGRKGAA